MMLTSKLFGRIAMFKGGGIGSPSTLAVRQFSAGISNSAGNVHKHAGNIALAAFWVWATHSFLTL